MAACAGLQQTPSTAAQSAAAPSGAALLAHEEIGDRLFLADFQSGRLEPVGPAGEALHTPVWSPDGTRLAYRAGASIWVHTVGARADARIADDVEIETQRPCVFSPDGKQIAVAGTGGAILVAAGGGGVAQPVVSRRDLRVGDLLWSRDGRTLVVLFWSPGSASAEVVRVGIADRKDKSQRVDDVARLLGWRPNGDLLVLRSSGGRDRAAVLTGSGVSVSRQLDEGLFVIGYSPSTDRLLVARSGEDGGSDAVIFLVPVDGGAPPRRWLASHPRLSDLHLSNDGRWALFVDRSAGAQDRPGGSIYVAEVGSENARLVLPATAARSFSEPRPRPAAGR